METKIKTPAITVILYILGVLLLVVAAFMLYTSVMYTKTYLASYGASFKDMWSNTIQYIITQTVPYLAMGLISIGVGKAAKGGGGATLVTKNNPEEWDDSWDQRYLTEDIKKELNAITEKMTGITDNVNELSANLEEIKVTGAIKLEELERRESYRIEDSRNRIQETLENVCGGAYSIGVIDGEAPEDGYCCSSRTKGRRRHFIK